jgi:hypothetical protein
VWDGQVGDSLDGLKGVCYGIAGNREMSFFLSLVYLKYNPISNTFQIIQDGIKYDPIVFGS